MQDGYDWQQLKYRDQHKGGLSWDMVVLSAERKARERIRSSPDRRLFDGMTVDQEEAFLRIAKAHSIMTSGLGVRAQDLSSPGGRGLGNADYGAALLAHYKDWRTLCTAKKISGLMAEDIIVVGLSLRECDASRKMRKGTAKINLMRCLDAWWDVR